MKDKAIRTRFGTQAPSLHRTALGWVVLAAALVASAGAYAGEITLTSKETPPALTETDHWQFMIATPGFMAGLDGTVGVNGVDADVDVGFDKILENLDMVFAVRMEASKGRFGIYGELIYLSMSDGAQLQDRLVNNTRVQVDEYLADAGLRWRLIEKPKFSLDLVAGTRYTNLYQRLDLTGNTPVIATTSEQFVTNISGVLRDRLNNFISDSGFVGQVDNAISARITNQLVANLRDNQRSPSIPVAPLAGRHPEVVGGVVEGIVRAEEARLRADIDALGLVGAAREAAVQQRVAAAQTAIAQRIATEVSRQLNRSFTQADFWFDPYIGLRGRYDFSRVFYTAARAEIGGFGVGSSLMWQVEAAIGINLTRSIFSEIGYRALSFDYNNDGLTFDTVTHGPQITTGIRF
jgi:hypothetical protein